MEGNCIDIDRAGCTGCTACRNLCPNHAISMVMSPEGFWEAYVDQEKCSGCGLCKTVCHQIRMEPITVNDSPVYYAAVSKDLDNIENSSSGGIFYELCKGILGESGVVYGAVQQSILKVVHKRAETIEGVQAFRRSKYLESNLGTCYREVKIDLEKGKKVLFSGVGCQIAGLYCYLQKEYENLYTCEVVCHGIPSHLAYEKYLTEKERQFGDVICGINFRDKSFGWKDNAICEEFKNGRKELSFSSSHPLHSVYLKGINMRSGCGSCQYAHIPRIADITLADFWQYQGKLEDIHANRGISLVAVNNGRGKHLLHKISEFLDIEIVEEAMALKSCRHMNHSPVLHKSQGAFFQMLQSIDFQLAADICSKFGAVIRSSELCVMTEIDEDYILEAFWKDEQEIVYFLDDEKKLKGIVTYGSFCRNYLNRAEWVNKNFKKVSLSSKCTQEIQEIFASNQNINRIPIVDERGVLIFEVRRRGTKAVTCKLDDAFLRMAGEYEKLFGNRRLMALQEWGLWKKESDSACVILVDCVCKKNLLWQKYHLDSVYEEDYSREMEIMEPFLQLCCNGTEVYFIKRPDLQPDYAYTKEERERIEAQKSFPKLSEDIAANEALLRALFKEKFSYPYIEALRKVPQIVEKEGRYQHVDDMSDYINVIGGCRKTCYQPSEYHSTIHMYGRCGVFGYAVEDADTMPSALQRLLVKDNQEVRVVNHGLWGADNRKILHNLSMDIEEGVIRRKDKVVLYMDELPCMDRLGRLNLYVLDSTDPFHEEMEGRTLFYDRPGHMNAEGYQYIAEIIFQALKAPAVMDIGEKKQDLQKFLLQYGLFTNRGYVKQSSLQKDELERYISEIKKEIPKDRGAKRGAIVMNCNPFTKGHRYLIEQAAEEVDDLIVFVVEEDKSVFPFQVRFEMVQEGTKDLENVHVLPSGRFMISALTFPEYFLKEQKQNIEINPVADVQIFAKDIAPRLSISVRFAGTEPEDEVTRQYNDALRENLPLYGIGFQEIERLRQGDSVVTATKVRKMLTEGQDRQLRELVPESTYDYLKKYGFLKREDKAL